MEPPSRRNSDAVVAAYAGFVVSDALFTGKVLDVAPIDEVEYGGVVVDDGAAARRLVGVGQAYEVVVVRLADDGAPDAYAVLGGDVVTGLDDATAETSVGAVWTYYDAADDGAIVLRRARCAGGRRAWKRACESAPAPSFAGTARGARPARARPWQWVGFASLCNIARAAPASEMFFRGKARRRSFVRTMRFALLPCLNFSKARLASEVHNWILFFGPSISRFDCKPNMINNGTVLRLDSHRFRRAHVSADGKHHSTNSVQTLSLIHI